MILPRLLIILFLSFCCCSSVFAQTPEKNVDADTYIESGNTLPVEISEDGCIKRTELIEDVFTRSWSPLGPQPPKAYLLCIHGLGLNSSSYNDFAIRMSKEGFSTYAIDVRGFGIWAKVDESTRIDFNRTLADIEKVLLELRKRGDNNPIFIVGESMGGAVALRATALYPKLIDGLVSSVPSKERFQQKKTSLKIALSLLTRPRSQVQIGEKVIDQATQDESLKEAWKNDPLNRLELSPKELLAFQSFMNDNHDFAKRIVQAPVLILQGCEDRLVKPEGTIDLFNEVSTSDRFLVLVGSGEHLLLQKGRFDEKLMATLLSWLNTHIPGSSS